jgi:cell division septation protein DedD
VRLLFALLLLANIAWYAWTHWVVRPADEAATAAPRGARLVLAREAPEAQPVARRSLRSSGNCWSLGPFNDLTDAARVSTLLRENKFQPRQRAGEGVVWKGFWVSLGGVADRQTAAEIIERLRRFGIGDAYAMPDDGRLVTISLGLFSERERALRRLDDVKALDLEPRIAERERKGTVYWIDVEVEPPAELPDAAQLQGEGGRILRLEVKACEP